ncbi:MAG: DUF4011 domain-containing protein, partial [Planctomycetes bacterium]|nr:DUF4011 domain-containing protein [Planctomycetota bacterium]
ELARRELPIEVFAIDEWPGLRSLPALLATFVMPNHPAVGGLLARTASRLRQQSGDGALDGYQRRDPARVVALAAAAFAALADCGISYANPPASFADDGQRVRLPDRVLGERVATCLDLALLYAAMLEQCGLHALVVVVEGHAFCGVWTSPDSFATGAVEDGLLLRKRVDLGEIALVEVTGASADGGAEFAAARAAARRHLDDLERFRCAIDLAAARRERILPLPVSADARASAAAVPFEVPVFAAQDSGAEPSPIVAPPAETSPARAPAAPESRLERWQRRLLDVGLRNRLVAFRETKRSLRVLGHDLALFEDALADGAAFTFQPRGESTDAAHARDRELHRTRTGVDLEANFLVEELARGRLHAPLDAAELERRLLETWRDARTTLEESGVNTLCLALGMLVWFESPSSGTPRKAPILLVPVELERISVREGFRLKRADDDVSLNETLLEKLRTEFGIETRGLDELPEDEHGIDVAEVLRRFRKLVRDVPRWDVVDEAWVAPFSFTKFLMWRDLAGRASELRAHRIVQHLVERPGAGFEPDADFVAAEDLDDELPPHATFCPLDADSSQLAAVAAAGAGRSFVLEGPPGTGKSQTIANLIAQCLATGKRVLFVAEKMAALEVVKRRLDKVGLGPFCLELHSNKTSKREVLDALRRALETANAREPEAWSALAARLAESRSELNGFVRALHRVRSFGESVFGAQAQLIAHREAPRIAIDVDAGTIDAAWVARRREAIDRARTACTALGVPDAHPLGAVRRTHCDASLPERAADAAGLVLERWAACEVAARSAGAELAGLDVLALPESAHAALRELVTALIESEGPAPSLLLEPDFAAIEARAREHIEELRARDALRAHVRVGFGDAVLGLDLEACLAELRRAAASVWPLSWWRARAARARLQAFAAGGALGTPAELIAHVEQALELKQRNAALASPGHAGRAVFGERLWNGGEPAAAKAPSAQERLAAVIEWARRTRRALAGVTAALPPALVEPVRARCASLAAGAAEELGAGSRCGEALRAWLRALEAHDSARQALDGLLELDAERAWRSGTAPYAAHQRTRAAAIRAAAPRLFDFCHWRATRTTL